ncbi:LamB/YcsF family protein [Arthrobacter sp. BL-252-APC-1A]|uniref:LamB/YcsF family protein n=1 Tax=Arthrobacter TaxID=1663 RepID=UPI0012B29748|nr:5-oxoprolinase subunit PxpA [Arthrobacter sp. BL-252-APC-1A]MSS00187.1 LamB/YcsF family protein [Arthrobacter sp. BL-252-APC-1A]
MATIDLNADVGESFGRWSLGDDAAMIGAVSSVNVACGFHAGDAGTMYAACLAAAQAGTAVGAHPGYRDLSGFGRRALDVDPGELTGEVIYQIGALQSLAQAAGTRVSYVKPHGALYNRIAVDPLQAQAVVDAVCAVDPGLPLVVLPGSVVERLAAQAGLRSIAEVFADRAYNPDGSLVSRTQPGAVLTDLAEITEHVLRLAVDGKIQTADGTVIDVAAESICVHGDTPGAVAMGQAVRGALESNGVTVASFI